MFVGLVSAFSDFGNRYGHQPMQRAQGPQDRLARPVSAATEAAVPRDTILPARPPLSYKADLPLPPTELQRSQGVHCPVASELLYCRNGTNYPLVCTVACSRNQMSPNDQRPSMTPGSATTRSTLPSNYMKVTTAGYAGLCCSCFSSTVSTSGALMHLTDRSALSVQDRST